MPRIFISYRRADTGTTAARIAERMAKHCGKGNVFFDLHSIHKGADFAREIKLAIEKSDIMLVIMGKEWLSLPDEKGNVRIFEQTDYVHIEVETGLNRPSMIVIPVLVDIQMPTTEKFPAPLKDLAGKNALKMRADQVYIERDIEALIDDIEKISPCYCSKSSVCLIALATLILLSLVVSWALQGFIWPIPPVTATRELTPTIPIALSPSPAITDRQELINLIRLEEEAVLNEDLSIIESIYLPNATIRNAETNGQTWPDPASYYSEKFQTQIVCTVVHHHIDVIELGSAAATLSTGSDGTWGWIREKNGCPNPFNNPAGSDLWEFAKDSADQWRIASFTFNIGRASHNP
jgi:hypothetical protein